MQRGDGKALLRKLQSDTTKMTRARGRVTGLLTTYFTTSRGYAADVLHAIFSTPRGAPTEFSALKIDECHRLLGLSAQQALLDTSHPLCMEYPAAAGGGVIRIFPTRGGGGAQVLSKQLDKHIETAKFLAALGSFMPFALLRISL